MKKIISLIFGLTFLVNVNAQQAPDSLIQKDYLEYVKRAKANGFDVQSKDEWYKSIVNEYNLQQMFPNSPGTYLIKAKNQIIGGFMIQMIAVIGESVVLLTAKNLTVSQANMITAAGGVLGLIGLGLEIGGVVNIGKAGITLNENGIGIKVKF